MTPPTVEQGLDARTLYEHAAVDRALPTIGEAIVSILERNGKRLRPAVLLAAARSGQTQDDALLAKGATAVELLHTATIVHDDIIDRGGLRRGQPTPEARFGDHKAATLGVWLLGRSVALIGKCGARAFTYASACVRELFDGQLMEVGELFNADRRADDCIAAARGKTASLFRLSAWLGGLLADGSPPMLRALESFGVDFGIAYQLADDILDLYPAQHTGKPAGKDVKMGVYTLPVLYALREQPRLRRLLAAPIESDRQLEHVLAVVRRGEGVTRALQVCRKHAALATRAVEDLSAGHLLVEIVDRSLSDCERLLR